MEIQNSDLHSTILSRSSKCALGFLNHQDTKQSLVSFSKDNKSQYTSNSLSDLPGVEKSPTRRSSLEFILNSTNENNESYDKDLESENDFESLYSSGNELEYSLDNQSLNYSSLDTLTAPCPISFSRHQSFGNIQRLSYPPSSEFLTVNTLQYNNSYPSRCFQNIHYTPIHKHDLHFSQGNSRFVLETHQHSMQHHLPIHRCNISNYNSIEMKNIISRHTISPRCNIASPNSSGQDSIFCFQSSRKVKAVDLPVRDSININTKKDVDIHEDSQKRKRLDPSQLKVLEDVFEYTYFPSTELRRRLAQQLGLTPRTIQIWFQNKRQNWRNKAKLKDHECNSSVFQHQRLQTSEISESHYSLKSSVTDSISSQKLVLSNIVPRDIELKRLRRESDVCILSKPKVMRALSHFCSSNAENFIDQTFNLNATNVPSITSNK